MPGRSRSTSGRPAGLDREGALYLRLAGMADGAEERSALRALADGLDWDRLRGIARRDGTTAEVHRRLLAAGIAVPPAVAASLAVEARVLDFHRLALDGAVRSAVALLAGAGLRVVLLKGAALARVAYARPTDRPMADADLLLAPDEASAAAGLLRDHGWTTTGEAGAAGAAGGARRYREHHHLPPLRAPDAGHGIVELHHDVLPPGHPFGWGGADVLARARPVAGAGALVPDDADLLLHACLHLAWSHELRHGAWRTFADLRALLAGSAAEVARAADALVARAGDARAATAVAWTLRLARDLGGVRLPPRLADAAAGAPGSAALARHLAAGLVPGEAGVPSVLLSRLLWERAIRPARSGHGGARPWRLGIEGVREAGRATPARVRAVAQLGRLAAWRRYGRRIIGG